MPLNKYFKGKGEKVMASMKQEYGPKEGEHIFYATVNARKSVGPTPRKKHHGKK